MVNTLSFIPMYILQARNMHVYSREQLLPVRIFELQWEGEESGIAGLSRRIRELPRHGSGTLVDLQITSGSPVGRCAFSTPASTRSLSLQLLMLLSQASDLYRR